MVAVVRLPHRADGLVLTTDRVRPAWNRPLRPDSLARLVRGAARRHHGGARRGVVRARGALRRSRERPDVRALRGHVPGARVGARARRLVSPPHSRSGLPVGLRPGSAGRGPRLLRHAVGHAVVRRPLARAEPRRRRAVPSVARAGVPVCRHPCVGGGLVSDHDGDRHPGRAAGDSRADARDPPHRRSCRARRCRALPRRQDP